MTPEEIQGNYECIITIDDYRINRKAEFKVVVQLSFYSSRTKSIGSTSWHIWRNFKAFRKLDEQLRKRNATHMKGIKFPPLHRRKLLFRSHLSEAFLELRMRELGTYMAMVIRSPPLVAFHIMSLQSQTLKAFIGYSNGFGSNPYYEEPQDNVARPSMVSFLPTSTLAAAKVASRMDTESVAADDDDDFRASVVSSAYSNMSSVYGGSQVGAGEYRWSGTGFIGSHSFAKDKNSSPFSNSKSNNLMNRDSQVSSFGRPTWAPTQVDIAEHSITQPAVSLSRGSMMSVTPSNIITPELDLQRAQMEEMLLDNGLMGIGMPPDGSCFLHCIVYEMYPLMCLQDYPSTMSVVNVGAADGNAPRRIAAAAMLRERMMDYALKHVETFASFLMQETSDLVERYESFRNTPDEQATIAELYVAATMFNIEIVLITNSEAFHVDPVTPVSSLPSVRDGPTKTITLGYMIPADGLAGHYICTRETNGKMNGMQNSFAGGVYRGSYSVSYRDPKRCGPSGARRFDTSRVNEQQPVE